MALVFEQMLSPEIGDASYLIGDDSAHVCAVIDPQVDVERYIAAARRHKLAVRFVIQTHVHEDFASGARALADACPGAELCVGGQDAPAYGFAHRAVSDGEQLELGDVVLTVRHTPGHTPEHIALLVAKADERDTTFAVLSGGSLLGRAAGRTDLLAERTAELTQAQFETLQRVFMPLEDGVQLYPTHVHGSPCGAAISDKPSSTLGHEKRHNPLLQHKDAQAFTRAALDGLPPKPSYYPRLKELNTLAPAGSASARVPALPPRQFKEAVDSNSADLIDTRHMLAFGGAHIPGAVNFGAAGHLAIQAGWMLDADRPLLLVLDSDDDLTTATRELARTGFTRFAGYLAGGMTAWQNAGLPLQSMLQLHVRDLWRRMQQEAGQIQVLDVRSPQEWKEGHAPGARHVFLPELRESMGTLRRDAAVAVYCDSGYRASIGASLLRKEGFDVLNVPGSWQAWQACALPEEK